jgi:hypothetical protein
LGVKDTTAIWFFQVLAGGINVVDFYEASGVGAEHYADELKAKAEEGGYKMGVCMVPHDAKVTEWGTGRTRIETVQRLGLKPDLVPDHGLMDGIQAARITIPMARFDRIRCKDGIEGLKQYRAEFDEERKVFKPKPLHDWASNPADAWRYLSIGWRALRAPAPEPKREVDAYIGQPDGRIGSHLTFSEIIKRQERKRAEAE